MPPKYIIKMIMTPGPTCLENYEGSTLAVIEPITMREQVKLKLKRQNTKHFTLPARSLHQRMQSLDPLLPQFG